MKTIQKESVAEYHNINISDAILMLPVMDDLAKKLNEAADAYFAHQNSPADQRFYQVEYMKIAERLNLMCSLGFATSDPWQRLEEIYPIGQNLES